MHTKRGPCPHTTDCRAADRFIPMTTMMSGRSSPASADDSAITRT